MIYLLLFAHKANVRDVNISSSTGPQAAWKGKEHFL